MSLQGFHASGKSSKMLSAMGVSGFFHHTATWPFVTRRAMCNDLRAQASLAGRMRITSGGFPE